MILVPAHTAFMNEHCSHRSPGRKRDAKVIRISKGKRYLSLLSQEGRILHVHHTGPAKGEVHFDRKFWERKFGAKQLHELLSNSYQVRELEGDIRIVRSK